MKRVKEVTRRVVPPDVPFVFHTHTGSPTGYSQTAIGLMRALWEVGVETRYLYVSDDVLYERESPETMVNALRMNKPDLSLPQVVYSTAPMFWHNSGAYRVGWSMIETDRINEAWVEACNAMHEVWVPTPWQVRVFRESGVKVPVFVAPLGYNPHEFRPDCWAGKWHGKECFRFLAVGWWQLRKRWDLLIDAFLDEFGDNSKVCLVCKIHAEETDESIRDNFETCVRDRRADNIVMINATYPWWELAALYRMCDAFVLPSGGEGWGMTFLEALACGLPTIAPDGLGTGEVLRSNRGVPYPGVILLPTKLEKSPVTHAYYKDANWWACSKQDVRAAMREVVKKFPQWKAVALAGAKQVAVERSFEQGVLVVRSHLERIYRGGF